MTRFLRKTYGADARPFLRPPYGGHNPTVDAVAAGFGYAVMTLWPGDLGDARRVSEKYILKMADRYLTSQTIVIGHLNHAPVTRVYGQLVDMIRDRRLRSVTLNDIFVTSKVTA